MLLTLLLITILISFAFTLFLEKLFLKYSIFIDEPNARSSHKKPVPTSGGLAILFSYLTFIYLLSIFITIDFDIFLILTIAIFPIITICLIDDFKKVNILLRLFTQFFTASFIIYYFQVSNDIFFDADSYTRQSALLIIILSVILSMWLMNLYNFMDGIDGYASLECIFISLAASLLAYNNNPNSFIYMYLAGLGAANLGFLIRNWYPAKIFMGDTGSVSLGCIIAFYIFFSASESILSIYTWLILLSIFIADASYTLLVRVVTKRNIGHPHLTHAFHIITIKKNSHLFTIKWMIIINMVWVFPLALLSNTYMSYHIVITMVAYLPLLFYLIKIGAGLEQNKN